ncbi:MAG: protein-L-isoaspartate(D-aspartate) O-methyltransferase [Halobacteriota archaeon]
MPIGTSFPSLGISLLAGGSTTPLERERAVLLEGLRDRGIGERVVSAMGAVRREDFVPQSLRDYAYRDQPLPIGNEQTISAPHMVAIMCELLRVESQSRVLEIGTGSGYHAAVLAQLAAEGTVYTIDRFEGLVENARKLLPANVVPVVGDGSLGLPEHAPFDRILVTCSAPEIPSPLLAQLKEGGRMVLPLGKGLQELFLVCKNNVIEQEAHGAVAFVLLIGKYGFADKH